MFIYTLYIFVFCISIQSSHEYDIGYEGVEDRLRNEHYVTASNIVTTTAQAVQNEKVCDTAVNLQKILKVMVSMLRQDVSQNVKTSLFLETLKDILRNTAGDNDEVMIKIDDLLHTLDKYKEPSGNRVKKHQRGILDNIVREPIKLNEQISMKYDIPVLINSYCTEALLNIIKIAYEAYVSLAKNPICNLPRLPEFPFLPGTNPLITEFMQSEPPRIPPPEISDKLHLKSTVPPFDVSDLSLDYQPPNKNSNYLIIENVLNPEKDTKISKTEPLLTQSETIYENLPNANNVIPTHNSQFITDNFPYAPQNQNNLYPNQIVPSNPIINEMRLPFHVGDGSVPSYFPQSQPIMPFDFTPVTPGTPYNTYPRPNPHTTVPIFPWPTERPEFPYAVKPQSTPYNPYTPDAYNPKNVPEVPRPLPWGKTSEYAIYVNPNVKKIVYEFPVNDQLTTEEFPSKSNPVIDSLYPNYVLPPPLPGQTYKPTVFEFPYQPATPRLNLSSFITEKPMINDKRNDFHPDVVNQIPDIVGQPNGLALEFFPVGSTLNPYGPYTPYSNDLNIKPTNTFKIQDIPVPNSNYPKIDELESEVFEFNLNPNDLSPNVQLPRYPYVPIYKNPVYKYKLKPTEFPNAAPSYPNIPANQNFIYGFKWNPYGAPIDLNIPKPTPYSPSAVSAQNLNSYLLNGITAPNTPEISKLKIIGFIKDAIKIIDKVIPIIKFDPPTLDIIARIKDIILQKDEEIEAEEFSLMLELYTKLINYVEQLKAYKEIIDIIDLSRVTNRDKLENKKVVELTYLVKRPQPVLYYPYYYVKYRMPYTSFLIETNNLIKEKPHLRMNPKQLYDELLPRSQVAETSPDLKNFKKEDILLLTFKSGSLVDTKLVTNVTLDEKLNVLRKITSDLTAEEILKPNKDATNQIQLVVNNPGTVKTYQTDNDTSKLNSLYIDIITKETDKSNSGEMKKKKETIPLFTQRLIREKIPVNTNQKDPTSQPNLNFTSFNSAKLRSDILRGDVGLLYSNYAVPTNVSTLQSVTNTYTDQGPIDPAMYKLFDATLKAKKRGTKQRVLMNSGGLISFDNSKVSLKAGNGNSQTGITFYNQTKLENTAKIDQANSVNRHSFTSLNKNNQANYQELINQHKIWTDQHNYYNTDGLVNLDNQKVLMNTGTGKRQDNVNSVDPKEVINEVADTVDFDTTRTSKTLSNLNFMKEGHKGSDFYNGGKTRTRFGVTSEGLQFETDEESSNEATSRFIDLENFAKEGMQFVNQEGIKNSETPNSQLGSSNTQDLSNIDIAGLLQNAGNYNSQKLLQSNNNADLGVANQEMMKYDATKLISNTDNTQKVGYDFKLGAMTDTLAGRQINSYIMPSQQIFYKRPILDRFSITSSPGPLVTRFSRPFTVIG